MAGEKTGILSSLLGGLSPLGVIAGLAPSVLQGIFSGIGLGRTSAQFNRQKANRPGYEIPEELYQNLEAAKLLGAQKAPGYASQLSEIRQASAREYGRRERGAISSNALMAGDIYQKELDAIQGLARMNEEWAAKQAQNINLARGAIGEQKLQKQSWESLIPWQTEMNRLGEQKASYMQGLMGALQGLGQNVTDLYGTKSFTDFYKGLYPQGGAGGSGDITKNFADILSLAQRFGNFR